MVEKRQSDQLQQEKQQQQKRTSGDGDECWNCPAQTDSPTTKSRDDGEPSLKLSKKGNTSGGRDYSHALAILTVGALLASNFVSGTNVNSSLVDDLLMNGNNGRGHRLEVSTESTPVNSSSLNFTAPMSNGTDEPSKTNHKRRINEEYPSQSQIDQNEEEDEHEHHLHHINFTLPLHDFVRPPIIVKHGNLIYEVVDNGTISTNVGTIAIPILTTPLRSSTRQGIFQTMTATVLGLRVEKSAKGVPYENGASKILANAKTVIRFFGNGFTNNTIVRFAMEKGERGMDCDDVTSTKYFKIRVERFFDSDELTDNSAVVTVTLPPLNEDEKLFYVCVREADIEMAWVHQGGEPWIILTSYQKWLPLWAHIILLLVLLALSGLFSGLNLGLMAIDRTEIKIIINAGSEQERRYAKQIRPLRDNGNYLLCSLLLGNVLVNASLTILLDDITSGLVAIIGSTVGIVIFGEIVPQAVCSRHGLAVGARTVWITKFFMAVTFPLSYPISIILDKVLGEEIGNVYGRERLKELINVTQGINDLEKQEVNINSGALDLKQKTVANVMTRLDEVYMLPIDAILDFDTVSEIMSNGYSRIPVYENQKGNVISLLYTKDLAFVDPDDRMPLRTICEFYSNPCHFVFENVTLNVLFNVFKQGNKGHMAFVQRIKQSDKADPTYEVIGLVTMEDIIEELIQEEISDETDVWEAAKKGQNDKHYHVMSDGTMTLLNTEGSTVSPQLTLAAFQYLSTAVEEFNDTRISKTVLERLLKQSIYFHVKIKNKEKTDPTTILYERGKPADYFIMVLEGKVHVEIGKEGLLFEGGPFTFFGTNSLYPSIGDSAISTTTTPLAMRKISQTSFTESTMQSTMTFVPEYTVRAVTDVTYFRISRSMYQAATQATMLEKTYNPMDSLLGEKIDEDGENKLDEVINQSHHYLFNAYKIDGKSKDKPLTNPGRGSITEVLKGQMNQVPFTRQLPTFENQLFTQTHKHDDESLIGDNNNICLPLAKREELPPGKKEELARKGKGNMSRVIICPKDEVPSADLRLQHQDSSFVPGGIVEGDEKFSCKL